MRQKIIVLTLLIIVLMPPVSQAKTREGCSTAVITGEATASGAPILWKNRDTSYLSNKVVYVMEKPYSYLGIVNAKEISGRSVYAGLNSAGFAIMNSVAYNLPRKAGETQDLEGHIMADALRTCQTVEDFENYIKRNLGESLGSLANFGIIDAQGQAMIFEVHNNGYKKIDASEAPEKYLINTNYSRSGKPGGGAGYLRFERTTTLFKLIPQKKITHQYIFQNISRDFGHSLLKHPTLKDLERCSIKDPIWIYSRDCINRPSSASAIIIVGKKPAVKDSLATLWVILGEPVTSIAVPLWVESEESPSPLHEGQAAPLCAEARRIKRIIRPYREGSKIDYMEVTRLVNKERTGFLPLILEAERKIFRETAKFLKNSHTREELADFQTKMATRALETLKKIRD
jgi:hypothetical protein